MCDATTVRTSPEEALRADLKSVARAACPALGDLDPALLEVVQISGGITNLLYKVSGGGGAGAAAALSVLVRIYGPNTEILINREEECDLFEELAGLKFGPPYLGRFSNGRVEGYLDQSRALEPDDMGATDPIDMISLIAQEMARMHSLQVRALARPVRLWQSLEAWCAMACDVSFDQEPSKQESLRSLHLYKYKEAVREVRQRLEGLHSSSSFADAFMADPVLCHGDLLSGNILHSSTWKRVQFIGW
jgi:ethanolamine kinase